MDSPRLRREAGHTKLVGPRAAEPLLAHLRAAGVVPSTAPRRCAGPVDELLVDYRRYLVLERGLLPASAGGYAVNVRPFLEGFAGPGGIAFGRMDGPAVVGFVVASRSSAKRTTKALRSLLRFLHAEGHIERPLAHAVPAAGGWRLASLWTPA